MNNHQQAFSVLRLWRALAITFMFAFASTSVMAHDGETRRDDKEQIEDTIMNPCPPMPEQVLFKGTLQHKEKTKTKNNVTEFTSDTHMQGRGVGTVSQVKYEVGAKMNVRSRFDNNGNCKMKFRQRQRVIPNGGPPSAFHYTLVEEFDCALGTTKHDEETDCKNEEDCHDHDD